MYKELETLSPKFGRMYVDKTTSNIDMGPPRKDDIVCVGIDESVECFVVVHEVDKESVKGEVLAIGSNPRESFGGFKTGDLVRFEEPSVRAIIRAD